MPVFGFGFNNEENIELALSNDTSQYLTLLPTREEAQALSFMQRILQESKNTVTEREKEAGPVLFIEEHKIFWEEQYLWVQSYM